jgi:hypothetical protein
MTKLFTFLFLFIICCNGLHAQDERLITKEQFVKLQQLSLEFKKKSDENRKLAFSLATKNNWTTFRIESDGTVISLQGVDGLGMPLYLKTFNNTTASGTTKTNSLYTGGSLGLSLNGSSNSLIGKLGIWDGGSVLGEHQEFTGGRIEQKDSPTSGSQHATHVAGTMVAKGVYEISRGMAWGLQKLFAYDFSSDLAEMATASSNGMAVSNHSYGFITGWNFNTSTTPTRWEWYGAADATEDYKFGFYDNTTRDWDVICYNAPFYLPVKSAGNNRSENGPAVGTTYFGFNTGSSGTLVTKGPRPSGISSNDSYDIISTTGTAKNILTVGAINGLPFGASNPSQIRISSFSSWGPTDDGRIKPDLVGHGVGLVSSSNSDTKSYATLSGTSMSAPNISGSLILLQEYYNQLNSGAFMRSATLKALAIATTDEAGTDIGPDYIFGWGLLNAEKAANLIKLNGTKSLITERNLAQGEVYNLQVTTSGFGPLKVTICWTDPEATPNIVGALNNRTPKLVNDLDLRIIKNTDTFLPWKLNPDLPAAAATKGDNIVDNVEQIEIADAVPGQVYTIRVFHKGTITKGPQNYSIVASGIGGIAYCSSTSTSTSDSRIDNLTLSNINNTAPNTCRSYSNFTSINGVLEAGKTYPYSINIGTCGGNFDKIAKLFVDWNSDGDFDDAAETVGTSNVINGTGLFTGNLTVPTNVTPDNTSLLRIVLTEGANAASVTACGNYAKGETQDYKVTFLKSISDAGVIALNGLTNSLCANPNQRISVRLKNFGNSTLTQIPVTVTIVNNGTIVKTLTENFTGSLAANNEIDFQLAGTFNTQAGQQYNVEAKTSLISDVIINNNSNTKSFTVPVIQAPTALLASLCDNAAGFYQLNGQADGFLYWYANSTSNIPVAVGTSSFSTTAPTNNTTFFVGVNDYRTKLGAKNKQEYSGGSYSGNFGPKPIITVTAPMVLDSALLYVSTTGQLTFTVENLSGQILSSTTINVTRSKTTADVVGTNGQTEDDPNDQGRFYRLGLEFPAAGTYRIGISYNGATIFRSNAGVTNIPFISPGNVVTLSGAHFETSSPPTITNAYYYFYDMLFKSLGCTNLIRTAVQISKPIITQTGSILTSSSNTSNKWFLNGNEIAGATSKTFEPTTSGVYRVEVTSPTGCVSSSNTFNYVLSAIKPSEATEIGLKVYPIPSNGVLNLAFDVLKKETLKISLTNLVGQDVYKINKENFIGKYTEVINTRDLTDGIYILNVGIGNKFYTQKITVAK